MNNQYPKEQIVSRRDFLNLSALSLGALGMYPWMRSFNLSDFPQAERLGRVTVGKVDLKVRPDEGSRTVDVLYEDSVVTWLRETIGRQPFRVNQKWVETADGYIWAPHVQPVRNHTNQPVQLLPETSLGSGMWAEVNVPCVDLLLANPPARSPWLEYRLEYGPSPRLYYSQIVWIDDVRTDAQNQVWYRVSEPYGSYGDIFWAIAEGFRPITPEEMTPISPEVEGKRILVNVSNQTLSCYEGNTEVYFARISSGAKFDAQGNQVDVWETPLGSHPIWRKLFSLHMSGGTTGGGWDLPAIGWTTLFVGSGIAVHSTFWHNNFGIPMSRGCVNARPEDAKWVFRWTLPTVPYDPGDVSVSLPGGTIIEVVET
jgi:lipoprotein-anchoring transpeptidase ErfK/SrfK